MHLEYPVKLIPDDNNTVRVEFLDFPEANTFGDSKVEALARAADALETVIEAYIREGRTLPTPSAGRPADATVAVRRS